MMDVYEQGSSGNHAAEPFDEDSLSSCLPEISDIFEDSVLFPRVGEQYQVEIPQHETKSELSQIITSSYDNTKISVYDEFGIGLAIPVKWVQHPGYDTKINSEKEEISNAGVVRDMEGSSHFPYYYDAHADFKLNIRESALENHQKLTFKHLQRSACKVDFLDSTVPDNHVAYSANHVTCDNDHKDYCSTLMQSRKAGAFYPFPGLPTLSWSDEEKQSFLLGLYIFGKNLIQVKKFMETQGMGDVLSFYYGKFYRSDAHRRWSECRKIRSRRSIHGQRIFTGWRQQELLSRILNSASKDLHDTLREAAKAFNDGRAILEEFVFKLKAAVGLQVLVDAIGIGKGTHDLTGVVMDHVRTNPTIPVHPEIPVGRACSSLTSADIIKFLTGDFRLSKARSNDLFWEAVWPRLLARGWHSEQPKDHGSLRSKTSLVFLIPGVKKFSRKRLVKGTHFFDSVSDVLSKVASDPRLLELDAEAVKCSSSIKEENGWNLNTKEFRNGSSKQQPHCYLHPKPPSCTSERLKFTVVDTSLVQCEGSFKVMEVRSFPSGTAPNYCGSSDDSRSETSSETEDSTNTSDDENSNPVSSSEKKPEDNQATQSKLSKNLLPYANAATTNGYAPADKYLVKVKDDKSGCQNSRRVRSGQSNCSATAMKRRKITGCSRGTDRPTCSVVKQIQQDNPRTNSKLDLLKVANTLFSNVSESQEKVNRYHYHHANKTFTNLPEEKRQSRTFFDLNDLPPDVDAADSSSNELKSEDLLQSSSGKHLMDNRASMQECIDEHQSSGIRRHSTRNRPPTAKALEALASGLLGTKRSWRPPNSTSRPNSRKSRKTYEEPDSAAVAIFGNVGPNTLSMSFKEIVHREYEENERKGTHELLGVP